MESSYIGNSAVVASVQGDVTGDKIPDRIFLTGEKTQDSPFIQDITLVVRDGKSGKTTRVALKENSGYNPTLFLGDFMGNGTNQILIRIDSGGSGAFTFDYIYSFLKNVPQLIFDSDVYNQEYTYQVNYLDFYRVEVISNNNKTKYMLDISLRGPEYLNEIYDRNGVLKEPIQGFVNPLSALFPVDVDTNGIYELLAFQKVAGRYNADALGYIQNFLRWNGKRFELFNQYMGIYGTDI
ncbi:MAG: spore coat protein [Oscillospiraceae bacterium]|jgi:hypothetical protein|nr:spore coat protein [Oscillospiraceae bacterium]